MTSKQIYYNEQLSKFRNDSPRTWTVINTLIGKHQEKSAISDIFNINNKLIDNPNVIADAFCHYFSNIGKKFAQNIPPSLNNFSKCMKRDNNKTSFFHVSY